jgi:hypothetical protein
MSARTLSESSWGCLDRDALIDVYAGFRRLAQAAFWRANPRRGLLYVPAWKHGVPLRGGPDFSACSRLVFKFKKHVTVALSVRRVNRFAPG